jgi:hypothetical protein
MLTLSKQSRAIADQQIKTAEKSDAPGFIATVNAIQRTDMRLQKLALEGGFSSSSTCNAIL